ncbi:MAG: helix-turn-helix domain-containing protein [Litorimonas sp.]
MKSQTIGLLSRKTGVKVTTIRYYETIGLMGVPDRTPSGQRVYTAPDVERLKFIRHARDLGFPIERIRAFVELQQGSDRTCEEIDKIAKHHLTDVQSRIRQLRALELELSRMVSACAGGEITSCKILEVLGNHEKCLAEHELSAKSDSIQADVLP